MKRSAALLLPVLVTACYTYAPGDVAAVQPGTGLRARISPTAAARIEPLLGTSDARVLTGTLIENSSGALLLEVPVSVQPSIGGTPQSFFQRVSIARADVIELDTRQLDRTRTGLLVAAAAVIGGSAALAALHGGPSSDRPPTGSSSETKAILWRLHF